MRQIFLLALRIGYQQPDLIVSGLPVVNDSQAAAFAAPASRPTQLVKTATARYDLAPIGTQDQRELQLRILIVIHELPHQPRERGRHNHFHIPHNTPLADSVSPKFSHQPARSAHSYPTKRQFALQGRGRGFGCLSEDVSGRDIHQNSRHGKLPVDGQSAGGRLRS